MEDPRLEELLDRWEDLHEQGKEILAEELCQDCPDLLEQLSRRIRALKSMAWLARRGAEADCISTDQPSRTLGRDDEEPHQDVSNRLLGEYTLLKQIGAGGMGQVFKAIHRRMDRIVAVKILPQQAVGSPQAVQRFQREVRATAKLIHPNIVHAYDAGEQDGTHYLVMEYVDGTDLQRLVQEQGPLPIAQAVDYVLQAGRGLEYAHANGVIHRDVKPANLLLDGRGTVRILDMGLAHLQSTTGECEHAPLTRLGAIVGTVDYMSPEQAQDSQAVDARSDIYSLGCTLYFLLTGAPLHPGDGAIERILAHLEKLPPSLSKNRPDVSEALEAVFQRMVARKPDERYQLMSVVIGALEQVSASLAEPKLPKTDRVGITEVWAQTVGVTAPPGRRKRLWPAALLVASVLLFACGWLYYSGLIIQVKMPAGTVVLELDQPAAEISIDGKAITITSSTDKDVVTIKLEDGGHELKITKAGFQTYARQLTMKSGKAERIKVRLEPNAAASEGSDRKAAEWVLRTGGKVRLAHQGSWISELAALPREPFTLEGVSLAENPRVTDAGVANLEAVKDLTEISLRGSPISDTGLRNLKELPRLRSLDLTSTRITDEGLENLPDLEELSLNSTEVTDAGLKHVAQLRSLQRLNLGYTRISDAGTAHLEGLTGLTEIYLSHTRITDVALRHIAGCKEMRTLYLTDTGISDDGLNILKGFKNLGVICIGQTRVSPVGRDRFRAALPTCRIDD